MAETIEFQQVLNTERLTLTLFDGQSQSSRDELFEFLSYFERLYGGPAGADERASRALGFYSTNFGLIQTRLLGGRRATRTGLWLIRLGKDSPQSHCVGVVSMIQRSSIPDQGWIIRPEHQGKGYATEAARELLRYFREDVGLRDAMTWTASSNPSSKNVSIKLGYVPIEGKLVFEDGSDLDVCVLPGSEAPKGGMVMRRFGRVDPEGTGEEVERE